MKLVVGLGNPGVKYQNTRHNLGFMVVDCLARRLAIDVSRERLQAWLGLGECHGHKVVLAKPSTFMNRSGQAVLAIGRFYKLELPDLLVVTDDLALPLGRLRLRARGTAGGHNGLSDIEQRLGSVEYARLRIGIDAPQWDATAHVLGLFDDAEQPVVVAAVNRAADAVDCWIEHGLEKAMNTYNRDTKDLPDD